MLVIIVPFFICVTFTGICPNKSPLMKKFLIVFLLTSSSILAQNSQKKVTIKYIDSQIKLDGVLDESPWQSADKATDFFEYFPF